MEYSILIDWLLLCLGAIVVFLIGEKSGERKASAKYESIITCYDENLAAIVREIDAELAEAQRADYEEVCKRG